MGNDASFDILFALSEQLGIFVFLTEADSPCHGRIAAKELGRKSKATWLFFLGNGRIIIVIVTEVIAIFISGAVLIIVAPVVGSASLERLVREVLPRRLAARKGDRTTSR